MMYCAFIGLGVTALMVWITEYYTSTAYRPVRSVAAASVNGHGTNVIQGLAISMESTALPIVVICVGIILAYHERGICSASRSRGDHHMHWRLAGMIVVRWMPMVR